MFIVKNNGKLYARRAEYRFNPSLGGNEIAYHYTKLGKNMCEIELLKQDCSM